MSTPPSSLVPAAMRDDDKKEKGDANEKGTAAGGTSALQTRRTVPDEVLSPSSDIEFYGTYRALTDFREPYRISPTYLVGTKPYVGPWRPDTPLIAFINARSGGRAGPTLAAILSRCLGQSQVFDVSESHPRDVLAALWHNLTSAEAAGDAEAAYIRRHLRIVVAGGDGTVTWILGSMIDLGLSPPPPVAVMPLGTGNDFSFNFGWGTAFRRSWVRSTKLYDTLLRFRDAQPREMDVWRVDITAPSRRNTSMTRRRQDDATQNCTTDDWFSETPHSLIVDAPSNAHARFWNYFSVGLDAQAAYGFHALREAHPRLASGRLMNQAWYGLMSCRTGWFCGSPPLTAGGSLRLFVKGGNNQGRDGNGTGDNAEQWRQVSVPSSVRAIVLLNLQSYGGGRDVWGLRSNKKKFSTAEKNKDGVEMTPVDDAEKNEPSTQYTEPVYDDGLIEVVGFRNGWHTALVMGQFSPSVHAVRLAQCSDVRMELSSNGKGGVKGEDGVVYMQLDGEPWPQAVPWCLSSSSIGGGQEGEPLVVRVGLDGRSRVLVNADETLGSRVSQWITARGLTLSGKHEYDDDDGGDGGGSDA